MHVVIAKVDETLYDGEAVALIVPGSEGQLTILPQHMPLITALTEGNITVRPSGGTEAKQFAIQDGILEVRRDGVTVVL